MNSSQPFVIVGKIRELLNLSSFTSPPLFIHLYIHIMFKKCQKHVKIISIKGQKQNKFFCEDENIQFNFIGIKIKIRYIYRNEKLI